MQFNKPSVWTNIKGKPRRAGFEFELTGIKPPVLAAIIADCFGGRIVCHHSLSLEVCDTEFGDFVVEMDTTVVKKIAAKLETKEDDTLLRKASKWIADVAEQVVPYEIVTPPLEFEAFDRLEQLMDHLRKANAKGTRDAWVNAFGMHINPDISSDDVNMLRDTLRAFVILYPWLKQVMDVDPARRVLPFIDPFPNNYVKVLLNEHYHPTLDAFIKDYLYYNPTRNRALDYLPLFEHLRPGTSAQLVESERKLVKARPAFHYRLPNFDIDNPEWTIARDWNYWVEVENLSCDKTRLSRLSADYLKFLDNPFNIFSNEWVEHINQSIYHEA